MLAESLFQRGKSSMEAGRYDEACADLRQSERIDPAGGTELTLALCYERSGRFGSAWVEFLAALATAKRDGRADRERIAREHAAAMEQVAPRLAVRIAAQVGAAEEMTLSVDGTVLPRSTDSALGIPVDPGTHVVRAAASGNRSWSTSITVERGDRREVVVPAHLPDTAGPNGNESTQETTLAEPLAPPVARVASTKMPREGRAPPPHDSASSSRRTLGYALGAVGIAGVATAGVLGALIADRESIVREHCPAKQCDDEGFAAGEQGRTFVIGAVVAAVAGAAALGTGIYLVSTDSERDRRPRASRDRSNTDGFCRARAFGRAVKVSLWPIASYPGGEVGLSGSF
jgi:hypothetical protein